MILIWFLPPLKREAEEPAGTDSGPAGSFQLSDFLHEPGDLEPGGFHQDDDKHDGGQRNAQFDAFLLAVSAGIGPAPHQHGQIVEGQDVMNIDSRENHQGDCQRADPHGGGVRDHGGDADAHHGDHGAHEHMDDDRNHRNQQRQQENVRRNGRGQDGFCEPRVHSGRSADGPDRDGRRQKDQHVDRDAAPGFRRQHLADHGHAHQQRDDQGQPADVDSGQAVGHPQGDGDYQPDRGALFLFGKGPERFLLFFEFLDVDADFPGRLEQKQDQHHGQDARDDHRNAHVFKPAQKVAVDAGIRHRKRVQRGIARQENHRQRAGCGEDRQADFRGVLLRYVGAFGYHGHNGHQQERPRPRMGNQQRHNERQDKNRNDDPLIGTDELDQEGISDPFPEAGILCGAGDQIGADDEPHRGARPGGERLLRPGDAQNDQQHQVDAADIGGLRDLRRPPYHRHQGEGQAHVPRPLQAAEGQQVNNEKYCDAAQKADRPLIQTNHSSVKNSAHFFGSMSMNFARWNLFFWLNGTVQSKIALHAMPWSRMLAE